MIITQLLLKRVNESYPVSASESCKTGWAGLSMLDKFNNAPHIVINLI